MPTREGRRGLGSGRCRSCRLPGDPATQRTPRARIGTVERVSTSRELPGVGSHTRPDGMGRLVGRRGTSVAVTWSSAVGASERQTVGRSVACVAASCGGSGCGIVRSLEDLLVGGGPGDGRPLVVVIEQLGDCHGAWGAQQRSPVGVDGGGRLVAAVAVGHRSPPISRMSNGSTSSSWVRRSATAATAATSGGDVAEVADVALSGTPGPRPPPSR